jgi:hypothetical protein
MLDQKYINYIKMKLGSGSTRESVTTELIGGGWTKEQIDKVFDQFEEIQKQYSSQAPLQVSPNPIIPPPKKGQLKGGNLSQVNAYVVPQEKDKGVGLFRKLLMITLLILLVLLGWYLFTNEGAIEKIYTGAVDLIEEYTPIDVPYLGEEEE